MKQCVPPYYALIGDSRGSSHDPLAVPTSGGGESTVGGAIPPVNGAEDNGEKAGDNDSTSSAGCSVALGSRGTGPMLAVFGVLGLLSALRRRRAG